MPGMEVIDVMVGYVRKQRYRSMVYSDFNRVRKRWHINVKDFFALIQSRLSKRNRSLIASEEVSYNPFRYMMDQKTVFLTNAP